jgi:hypothetical protein
MEKYFSKYKEAKLNQSLLGQQRLGQQRLGMLQSGGTVMSDNEFWSMMRKYNKVVEDEIKEHKTVGIKPIIFIYKIPKDKRIQFIKKYKQIYDKVYKLMFSDHSCTVSKKEYKTKKFCEKSIYPIGGDDSHWDFARYIIRNGLLMTETFINNPSRIILINLAKKMNSQGSLIDAFNDNGEYIVL